MFQSVDVFKLCCADIGQRSEFKSVTVKIKLKNNIGEPKKKKITSFFSPDKGHGENSDLQRSCFFFPLWLQLRKVFFYFLRLDE